MVDRRCVHWFLFSCLHVFLRALVAPKVCKRLGQSIPDLLGASNQNLAASAALGANRAWKPRAGLDASNKFDVDRRNYFYYLQLHDRRELPTQGRALYSTPSTDPNDFRSLGHERLTLCIRPAEWPRVLRSDHSPCIPIHGRIRNRAGSKASTNDLYRKNDSLKRCLNNTNLRIDHTPSPDQVDAQFRAQ